MSKLGQFAAACAAEVCGFGAEAASLPAEYQEVEYVEATGLQYVDTGYVPNAKTEIVAKYQLTKTPTDTNKAYVFGEWGSAGRLQFAHQASGKGFFGFGEQAGYDNSTVDLANDLNVHVVAYTNGMFTVDGAFKKELKTWGGTPVKLWLFACNGNGSPSSGSLGFLRIYSCQIYSNKELVCDLVPCYETKENGAIGFYDTIGKKFCTNGGSGTLGKGRNMGADRLLVVCDPAGYGLAAPAVGAHYDYAVGTDYTLTASANWTSADGCSRAVCVGCTVFAVDGDVVAFETFSGEGDVRSITYRHPECERGVQTVWQWAVENKVTVTADAGATVTEPTRWVARLR